MKSILSATFRFDDGLFNDGIIYLSLDSISCNLYDLIMVRDANKEKLSKYDTTCRICKSVISKGQKILKNYQTYTHINCDKLIDKILTYESIFDIKISINGIIRLLPVYYYIGNTIIICTGSYLECWYISTRLSSYLQKDDHNIIGSIIKLYNVQQPCRICRRLFITGCAIYTHNLCYLCGELFMRFKDDMIIKFMHFDTVILKDICIKIMRSYVDIYTFIIELSNITT